MAKRYRGNADIGPAPYYASPDPPRKTVQINGYCYQFNGRSNWRTSSDERWEVVMRTETTGVMLGSRMIDGVRCSVMRVTGTIEIVAATEHAMIECVACHGCGKIVPKGDTWLADTRGGSLEQGRFCKPCGETHAKAGVH